MTFQTVKAIQKPEPPYLAGAANLAGEAPSVLRSTFCKDRTVFHSIKINDLQYVEYKVRKLYNNEMEPRAPKKEDLRNRKINWECTYVLLTIVGRLEGPGEVGRGEKTVK